MRLRTSSTAAWAGLAGVTLFACAQIAGVEGPSPSGDETRDGGSSGAPGDDAAPSDVDILPNAIDFGTVDCGRESGPKTLTIHNKGATDAPYKIVVPSGVPYRVDGALEGNLGPNGVATVNVVAKPTAAGVATAPLVVTAGAAFRSVDVSVSGGGAQLSFAPSLADVGEVRMESGGTATVELHNDGTKAAFLTKMEGAANGLTIDWQPAGTLKIDPGAAAPLTVTLAPSGAEDAAPVTTTFVPTFDGSVCGAPPALAASGRRMNYEVTIGSGDFGSVACNDASPPSKDVVITNYSDRALTWTTSTPTSFVVVSGATGSLAAGATDAPTTGKIVVAPKPIGAKIGPVSEDLTVTISGIAAPSGGPRTTKLRYDVRGAVITVAPLTLSGFQDPSSWNQYDTKSFAVTNAGNEPIALDWTFDRTKGDLAWAWAPPSSVGAGATEQGYMSFNVQGFCPCEATLTPKRRNQSGNAALCSGQKITFEGSN